MSESGSFHTLAALVQNGIEIKSSRFLALAWPVSSEGEVQSYLDSLSKKFSDATHICYACRIGTGSEEVTRTFDAGEPNFTAGKPILNAILSQELTDVIVAVVRWFGGTKLGKANLAKAYRQAAEGALQKAEKIEKFITQKVVLRFEPDKFNLVQSLLLKYKSELLSKSFNTNCRIVALVPQTKLSTLKERLKEVIAGKIIWE